MLKIQNLKHNYQRFLKNIKKFSVKDQKVIIKAYKLARKSHDRQKRDEGPLYIIHPIRMANILMAKLKIKDSSIIAASLLHDVVEDTSVTITQIKKTFDQKTYELIKGITRLRPKNETEKQKKKNKKKNFKKIMKGSAELKLLKSVDVLDNVSSWPHIPKGHDSEKKFKRWFQEARMLYLPLAKKADKYIYQETKKAFKLFKKRYGKDK